jgi:signal transduction histidine kinase
MRAFVSALRPPRLSPPLLNWSLVILAAVLGGLLVFAQLNIPVLRRIGMPHEFCYLREPKLVWLHVVSDGLIGVAYVSISLTLGYMLYRASRNIPFNGVFLAFGLFIISCGITHFMEVWVIWDPVYWLSGYVRVITAAASAATAVALIPLVPKIFRLIAAARESDERKLKIERLNAELEQFNYSLAHDLRAPLRAITSYANILNSEFQEQLPPEALQHIAKMEKAALKMDHLTVSLLKYASIGRQPIAVKRVDLAAAIRDVLALLESDIRAADAEVRMLGTFPEVNGDEALLQAVLQNLISNALKFVNPGTRPQIEISAHVREADVQLEVADNGIGIPPLSRKRIFELFERVKSNHAGTGVGLSIVYRAVKRMNGEVGVVDNGSTGSRFWVRLPRPEA